MRLPATRDLSATGLYVGALAWAVNQQTAYTLVPWLCEHHHRPLLPVIAAALALLALAGAAVSGLALRATGPGRDGAVEGRRPRHFLAWIGMTAGLIFAAVIAVQGSAALVLQGCER